MKKFIPRPQILDIAIPSEVEAASRLVEAWFADQHVQGWVLHGLCSRKYFEAVQRHVPTLRKLKQHPLGMSVIAPHNSAVESLKTLVMLRVQEPTGLPHEN